MKIVSHRRHKNNCTCGEKTGILKDFFNPSAGAFKV